MNEDDDVAEGFTPVYSRRDIPAFANEDEAAAYWDTHDASELMYPWLRRLLRRSLRYLRKAWRLLRETLVSR